MKTKKRELNQFLSLTPPRGYVTVDSDEAVEPGDRYCESATVDHEMVMLTWEDVDLAALEKEALYEEDEEMYPRDKKGNLTAHNYQWVIRKKHNKVFKRKRTKARPSKLPKTGKVEAMLNAQDVDNQIDHLLDEEGKKAARAFEKRLGIKHKPDPLAALRRKFK